MQPNHWNKEKSSHLQLFHFETLFHLEAAKTWIEAHHASETTPLNFNSSKKNELECELLHDVNSGYARKDGLVFNLPKKQRAVYASFDIELEKQYRKGQFDLPLAAQPSQSTLRTLSPLRMWMRTSPPECTGEGVANGKRSILSSPANAIPGNVYLG